MRLVFLAATGIVWAVMMAALVQREVLPYFEYMGPPTYRTVLRSWPAYQYTRRGIFSGHERAGESIALYLPDEGGGSQMFSDFQISIPGLLKMLGTDHGLGDADTTITVQTTVQLDQNMELVRFRSVGSMLWRMEIEGKRLGDQLYVHAKFGHMNHEEVLDVPPEALMASSFMPMQSIGRPSIGKRWRFPMIQPDLGGVKFTTAYAQVEEREEKVYLGKKVSLYRVEIRKDPSKQLFMSRLWVNDEGEVLIEEMPMFRLTYESILEEKKQVTPEEAKRIMEKR